MPVILTQRIANIVFALAVVIACGWFAWLAQEFEASGLLASSGLPSKFFPQLTLAVTAICAVIVVFANARRSRAGPDAEETVFDTPGDARRGLLMLLVAVASYVLWREVGFIPMAVLMGPASLLAMGIRKVWIYVAVLVLTGVIWAAFSQLLGIQLV